jgi:hypothetical protein
MFLLLEFALEANVDLLHPSVLGEGHFVFRHRLLEFRDPFLEFGILNLSRGIEEGSPRSEKDRQKQDSNHVQRIEIHKHPPEKYSKPERY